MQLCALAEGAIQTLRLEIEVFVFSAGAPLQEGAEWLGLRSLGTLAVTYCCHCRYKNHWHSWYPLDEDIRDHSGLRAVLRTSPQIMSLP